MAAFQIELLHRADEHREPFRAERYDIHTPDLAANPLEAIPTAIVIGVSWRLLA